MSGQQLSHRSSESQKRRSNEGLPPLRIGRPMMSRPELTSTSQIPIAPGTAQLYYHMMMPPSTPQYNGDQTSHMGFFPSTSGTALIPHTQVVNNRPVTSAAAFLPHHPPSHQEQHSNSAVDASISPNLSQPDDDDGEDIPPIVDPGVKSGRGIGTGGVIPHDDPAQRVALSIHDYGGFTTEKANKVISYLVRMNFDPNYLRWNALPSEHREKIWNQFGRYFRWERDEEAAIFSQYNKIAHIRFIKALSKAKEQYDVGKRVKWLGIEKWEKLARHWMKDDVKIISARAARNRGVQINEEGQKVPAKATYFGGTTSMYAIDKKQAQIEDRPFAGQSIETFVKTHVRKIPNLAKDELYTGRNDLQWGNEISKGHYERYMRGLIEKYRDNPNAMPHPLEPMDTAMWEQATGGVKGGRLPGV